MVYKVLRYIKKTKRKVSIPVIAIWIRGVIPTPNNFGILSAYSHLLYLIDTISFI